MLKESISFSVSVVHTPSEKKGEFYAVFKVSEDNYLKGGSKVWRGYKVIVYEDGKFELLLIRTPRNLTELSECIQALQSQKYNCSAITFRSTSHLRVSSNEAVTWTLDGEREDVTGPVEVHNLHHAVSLLLRG